MAALFSRLPAGPIWAIMLQQSSPMAAACPRLTRRRLLTSAMETAGSKTSSTPWHRCSPDPQPAAGFRLIFSVDLS